MVRLPWILAASSVPTLTFCKGKGAMTARDMGDWAAWVHKCRPPAEATRETANEPFALFSQVAGRQRKSPIRLRE